MTDYERGVEQASAVYKEVIREYVAENAKLREENVRFIIKLNVEHIVRQNVESENAKLRELAHILCHCMQINANCDDCRLNGAKGEIAYDQLAACDSLHELLSELGIEVDG